MGVKEMEEEITNEVRGIIKDLYANNEEEKKLSDSRIQTHGQDVINALLIWNEFYKECSSTIGEHKNTQWKDKEFAKGNFKNLQNVEKQIKQQSEELLEKLYKIIKDQDPQKANNFKNKIQKFAIDQTEKAKENLRSSVGENKVLKAAWGVIVAVCDVIKVTIQGVINSAIANGKLAVAAKNFGEVVSNSFQKSPTHSRTI